MVFLSSSVKLIFLKEGKQKRVAGGAGPAFREERADDAFAVGSMFLPLVEELKVDERKLLLLILIEGLADINFI